jgi:hypothetical protein
LFYRSAFEKKQSAFGLLQGRGRTCFIGVLLKKSRVLLGSRLNRCKGIIVVLCDLFNKYSCMSLFSVVDFSLSTVQYASCI